ncbi:MAG TPA: glycosyltransferase family 4 protein [Gemmatimonadaceae bacterium]|nr:glycosyltransferase family 4 protein [Gemmatimonadaceae bacterium]
MNHLFVSQDYGPHLGGMARRHVELCRRFGTEEERIEVSTMQLSGSAQFDSGEPYPIHRQPFDFSAANRFSNQMKWGRWLRGYISDRVDVIHLGNIRPVGYALEIANVGKGLPYLVYVNGGDLLRERRKAARDRVKRFSAKRILGNAAGIVATSKWVAELSGEVMQQVGVKHMPPVGAFDLGTDPAAFSPMRDTRTLRARWGVGDAPLLLTVARLVPHKGQDAGIRALAALAGDLSDLRYILVGEGHDEVRLRDLAQSLGILDRIVFAGTLDDSELAEAYATATIYVGASRIDSDVNAEGFGISFVEAAASGLPVVAGDSGGVRSAVRHGETGMVVPPQDVEAIAAEIRSFIIDEARRVRFGTAGRKAVETHYNWDRVARDTRRFTLDVVNAGKRA